MRAVAATKTFEALGGRVTVQAEGPGSDAAVEECRLLVLDLHDRLTRFEEDSELCRLNRDPRESVPSGELMLRFADAVRFAGEFSGGLVDATLLDQVERAGYTESIDPDSGRVEGATASGQPAAPAQGSWARVSTDHENGTVTRPPGVRLDSGGIGKGLAADIVAEHLQEFEAWAVECSGDLRFGGTRGLSRRIDVTSPVSGGGTIADFTATEGAIATSGTTRRSWQSSGGRAHHLIDPRTGLPARTGIIQATAVAPTAVEAEVRTKSALLSGPDKASEWLSDGGVIVTEQLRVLTWGFEERRGL